MLLAEEIAGPLQDNQKELLGLCRKNLSYFWRMLENLTELFKIHTDSLEIVCEPIDLCKVVTKLKREWAAQAGEKSLVLNFDLPGREIRADCDEIKVTSVLRQLMDNALKFAPAGSEIHLGVSDIPAAAASSHRPVVHVVVANRLEQETALSEAIFEPFYPLHSPEKKMNEGIGLGLALCRAFTLAQGGELWHESKDGTVRFFLQLESAS